MHFIYSIIFRLIGWRIEGSFPSELQKFIIAIAPHTSNWDFIIGIMARSLLRITDARFLGKSGLFKPPFGWFFRWLGGYPVDRSTHHDMVKQAAAYFKSESRFILAIAPEGTRKKVDKLKTGFYYIAKEAGVPIIPVGFDFSKKAIIIDKPFYPSDNIESDIHYLTNFYKNIKGQNPESGIG